MKYEKARELISEAIEQLDEMTDAELKAYEALLKAHEARMAKQERTAYKSPTMKYHLERLERLARPATKKPKGKGKKIAEAIEQIDELSKGTYGSYIKRAAANIDYEKTDTNPENEESVEKKVRRRLKGIGRAVKALGGQYRGAGNKRKQIDEADGNPAPYGWNVKKSPSGRTRYVPKTKEQWHKESEKFHAKNPGHWERVRAFQKANPLNPDMDDHITGPDDHLPGGVGKKARAERQAAIKAHRRRIAEASNLRRHMSRGTHRMASLLRRAGATPEEVRQGMTGKRTPAAKKGRALLAHAMKSAQKKASENMPNYPYGRKGLSESVSEGMVKAVNKLKKRNFLASKGTAMRPSAFVSPAAHKAALVASAREKMK